MSEFLNANSGWISILSLVLVIPLGILSNLATPKLRSWWSLHSRTALKRQVNDLKGEVTSADRLVSDPTFAIATFTSIAAVLIGYSFLFFFFVTLALILILGDSFLRSAFGKPWLPDDPVQHFLVLSVIIVLGFYLANRTTSLNKFMGNLFVRVADYKEWRERTLNKIEELKLRLSEWESQK